MRPMLFHRANGQHGDAVFCDGLANLRPGEFFIAIFIGHKLKKGAIMSHTNFPDSIRPSTAVLTLGYDPSLSVGSARPAVFRSSTYVFSSPEAAERAFDIMGGRAGLEEGEKLDLVYSRFSHPNAEILEDHIVPLETAATSAAIFNAGMAAIMTAVF